MSKKNIQRSITFALLLTLVSILGGYVYFGMRLAQQHDNVVEIPVATTTEASTTEVSAPLTREQKMEILHSLVRPSGSTTGPTLEERKKILNSLQLPENATQTKLSEEQKKAILEHLQR